MANRLRERVLDAAIAAGKFPAERREFYRQMWDADPVEAGVVIAKLPGKRTAPAGRTSAPAASGPEPDYDPAWLTASERQRLEAASGEAAPAPYAPDTIPAPHVPQPQPAPHVPGSPRGEHAEGYEAGWLTDRERAHIDGVKAGKPFPTIAGEGNDGQPARRPIASAAGER